VSVLTANPIRGNIIPVGRGAHARVRWYFNFGFYDALFLRRFVQTTGSARNYSRLRGCRVGFTAVSEREIRFQSASGERDRDGTKPRRSLEDRANRRSSSAALIIIRRVRLVQTLLAFNSRRSEVTITSVN